MQVDFQQTMRAIALDRQRAGIDQAIIGLLMMLVLVWIAWLFIARLPLYEVSSSARIELSQPGSPIEAATAGRVAMTRLTLGPPVRAGDLLIEFNGDGLARKIEGPTAEIAALLDQLAARRSRTELAEHLLAHQREQSRTAITEARAKVDRAR